MQIVKKVNWSQDEKGIWWYHWGKYIRSRGQLIQCEQCGQYAPKLLSKKNKSGRNFCSWKCGAKAVGGLRGKVGNKHWAWKGGRHKVANGYIEIYNPQHPHARGGKYVREHRLVMEKHLGRLLEPYEQVHHKNGVKSDNRLGNLELISYKIHLGAVKCPYCKKTFKIK